MEKTRGKASRESHRSRDPREGNHDTAATAREETARACPNSIGGKLSMRGLERIPGIPVVSQEEVLSTGKARGTPGSCHHSQSPPDVSVQSRETCFPALPRLSSQGSTHTTVAHGTALWESLVGKPRRKASRESHRSLDPHEGKHETAATAREESARACPHSR